MATSRFALEDGKILERDHNEEGELYCQTLICPEENYKIVWRGHFEKYGDIEIMLNGTIEGEDENYSSYKITIEEGIGEGVLKY